MKHSLFFWKVVTALLLILCVTMGLLLYMDTSDSVRTPSISSKNNSDTSRVEKLVEIVSSGGYCLGTCPITTYHIYSDGSYYQNDVKFATISASLIEGLQSAIQNTDFDALLKREPNQQGYGFGCQSAVDGPDLIYTFYQEKKSIVIDMCKIPIESHEEPFITIEHIDLVIGS